MYKWIFFIALVTILACKGPSSVPSSVLDYNEMKEILWDMAQVDEFVMVYVHGAPQKVQSENLLLYSKVFALHKISNTDFTKSYSFYKSHPVQEKVLMDSLTQYSTRQRQDRFVPIIQPPKPSRLVNPAPMRFENSLYDWHQYQFQTNFW